MAHGIFEAGLSKGLTKVVSPFFGGPRVSQTILKKSIRSSLSFCLHVQTVSQKQRESSLLRTKQDLDCN